MKVLVVTSAFGDHSRGSTISDPAEIEAVLAGENAHYVITSDHAEPEPDAAQDDPKPGKAEKKSKPSNE